MSLSLEAQQQTECMVSNNTLTRLNVKLIVIVNGAYTTRKKKRVSTLTFQIRIDCCGSLR